MSDASRPAADRGGYQQNNGNVVYATQGNGNINLYGPPPVSPEKPHPVNEQIRVLMLAANPLSTGRLAIDEEARQITERLRLSRDRDAFDLITCGAVRPQDLLQYFNQHNPHIVHFSGHGDRTGNMVLSAGDGTGRWVGGAALAGLFRAAGDRIRVIVLNACHSAAAVQAISPYVDYIVGMRDSITDEAAIIFAASFYSVLGFGHTIPEAFEQAAAVLGMCSPVGQHVPELVTRPNAYPYLTEREQ